MPAKEETLEKVGPRVYRLLFKGEVAAFVHRHETSLRYTGRRHVYEVVPTGLGLGCGYRRAEGPTLKAAIAAAGK